MKDESKAIAEETSVGVAKGLLGAVPFVGTILTEVTFDIRSRLKQRRFEEFVNTISQRLEKLESKLDAEHIKSEEFVDLWDDVVHKVMRNRSKEKLQLFSDIITSSMCRGSFDNTDVIQLYLSVLETLAEPEFKIINSLYTYTEAAERKMKNEGKELEIMAIDYSQPTVWGIKTEDFKLCFETLISKGLVYDDSAGRWDTKLRTFIKPTTLTIGLVKFIKDSQAKVSS